MMNFKRLATWMCAAALAFTSTASAEECEQQFAPREECGSGVCRPGAIYVTTETWMCPCYLSVRGGVNALTIDSFHKRDAEDRRVKGKVRMESDAFVTLAYGCALPRNWRMELELGTRYNRFKDMKIGDVHYKLKGYIKSLDLMLNTYYELPQVCGVTPFVGTGFGYAYQKNKFYNETTHYHSKYSNNRPCVQYMGGLIYDVYCGVQFGLEYRYFQCFKNLHNHGVNLNMNYYF